MAKPSRKRQNPAPRKRRLSALMAVVYLLIIAGAMLIAWASLTYQPPEKIARDPAKMGDGPEKAGQTPDKPEKPEETDKADKSGKTDEADKADKAKMPEKSGKNGENGKPAEDKSTADQEADKPTEVAVDHDPEMLPPAPIAGLSEKSKFGLLPKVAADGRTPLQAYARPHQASGQPLVAVVVAGLGLDSATTAAAIDALPRQVTLAFSPYGRDLQRLVNEARGKGHEILLELPMEPDAYPNNDPGPLTLLVTAPARLNVEQTEKALARFAGYAGVVNFMGARFMQSDESLRPVFLRLKQSGLMFLDSRAAAASVAVKVADNLNLPRAYVTHWIDEPPTAAAVAKQLQAIERTAFAEGQAIAITRLYPVTVNLLAQWTRAAEAKGLELAPVSAIANKQEAK